MNHLSPNSRIWVYAADRFFTDEESIKINHSLQEFMKEWNAHGKELSGGYQVVDNSIILLAVDESKSKASGCSIDSSVKVIKELSKVFNIDFFNRLNILYKEDGTINFANYQSFITDYKSGKISKEATICNLQIQIVNDLDNLFTPVHESWLASKL